MKSLLLFLFLSIFCLSQKCLSQEYTNSKAFISINFILGKKNILKPNKRNPTSESFGISISAGIPAIKNSDYQGGVLITLIQGFFYNKNKFDSQLGKKANSLSQIKGANIGWFSHFKAGIDNKLYHNIGIGLINLNTKNKKLDLGVHNSLGAILNYKEPANFSIGLSYYSRINKATKNKNQYNNFGLTIGAFRNSYDHPIDK